MRRSQPQREVGGEKGAGESERLIEREPDERWTDKEEGRRSKVCS